MITLSQRARSLRLWLVLALASLVLSSAGAAHANGRFPRAQRLLEDPHDSNHLILGATYGLLVTIDRGAHWQYVCEGAYGETELSIDALTALSPTGALLAGIYSGVARAVDGACAFQRTLGRNNREAVPDFALAASTPGRVIAILTSIPADAEPYSQLYRSDDDGVTWRAVGKPLPAVLRTPLTVDVAPSDSNRVYLSGLDFEQAGLLLRSDDGGESFDVFALPTDPAQTEYPYIAAVDPKEPDRLYLRTDAWRYDPQSNSSRANDALLYSEDGGESFSELMRAAGKLFGFAFSPNGRELMIGYGDPLEAGGNRFTDPDALGMYRAPKGESSFQKRYAGSVSCLTWSERGIYVCTPERQTGYSLGLIDHTDFELDSPAAIEPLLALADVVGPVDCPPCSSAAVCSRYWYSTCQSWGRADCTELQAPVCGAGGTAGGDGGSAAGGDGSSDGAGAGAPPSTAGGASFAGRSSTLHVSGGGCACRSSPMAAARSWVIVLLLASILAARAATTLRS